jgi:chromosome segregation ATPase
MNDIEELQRRITAAMDRVAYGLEQLSGAASGDAAEVARALEDEKLANAQLSERRRVLTDRQDQELSALKDANATTGARTQELDLELQRLRKANTELRQSNQALRAANEAGVGEPHLINKSMMAELEALRAVRAADLSETNAIIDALTPLVGDAATGEDA